MKRQRLVGDAAVLVGAAAVVWLIASAAAAFEVDPRLLGGTDPDSTMIYRYYGEDESPAQHWPPGAPTRQRMWNATQSQWVNRAGGYAGFGIAHNNGAGNIVGWGYGSHMNGAIAHVHGHYNTGNNGGHHLHVSTLYSWYSAGTGAVSNQNQRHLAGVLVHEIGHWVGLDHCDTVPHFGPDGERLSMCFGTVNWTQRHLMYSLSQGDIQGAKWIFDNQHVMINSNLSHCPGGNWTCTPTYFQFSANSNHWWGGGVVSMNDNSSVPFPEIVQKADGGHVDQDNDGRFALSARVIARDDDVFPRAVVFARWGNGANERKCDSGGLTVGVWKTVSCTVDLPDSDRYDFEFGVRVTEKIEINWIRVRDLD